jgi:hypothetical protein
MPEQIPLKDPRFRGKRYEIQLSEGDPRLIQESAEVCADRIAVFESLLTEFENFFNLEELRAITGFSSREERINSPRHTASQALSAFREPQRFLASQEAVPKEVIADFRARYKILNRAVGAVTSDPTGVMFEIVDHNR